MLFVPEAVGGEGDGAPVGALPAGFLEDAQAPRGVGASSSSSGAGSPGRVEIYRPPSSSISSSSVETYRPPQSRASVVAATACAAHTVALASGVLRVLSLPEPADSWDAELDAMARPLVHFEVTAAPGGAGGCGAQSISLSCPRHADFYASDRRLFFVAPERAWVDGAERSMSSGAMCACFFDCHEDLEGLAESLAGCGYAVRWQARDEMCRLAGGVQEAGSIVATSIRSAAAATATGIRAAGGAVRRSQLLEPESVEVPAEAREAVAAARTATRVVATTAGRAVDGLASVCGWAAAQVRQQLPEVTEQWQADARALMGSSLVAGSEVWGALSEASGQLCSGIADASAGVIGHKYGAQAEEAARDGMHAVGNVLQVRSYVTGAVVAPMIAAKSAREALAEDFLASQGAAETLPPAALSEDAQDGASEQGAGCY